MDDSSGTLDYISPYGSPSVLLVPSLLILLLALSMSHKVSSFNSKTYNQGTASTAQVIWYTFMLWTVGVWYFVREQVSGADDPATSPPATPPAGPGVGPPPPPSPPP